MPLVHIHLIRDQRSPEEIKKFADVVYKCIFASFAAPVGDRYQLITQHSPGEIICEDTGLGITRTDKIALIQIVQQGRNAEKKKALYKMLAEKLEMECGLDGSDLIISVTGNEKEDWSFGYGRAQFLTGDL